MEKYYFSFEMYFQQTSAFSLGNTEKITLKTSILIKRIDIGYAVHTVFKRIGKCQYSSVISTF